MNRIDLKSKTMDELAQWVSEHGEPAFRAKQLFRWMHTGATQFEQMTNLSKKLRETLQETCYLTAPQVEQKQVSAQDGTIKYLWRLGDGNCVETVLLRYQYGNTVCISSQVGCRMGCAFCASTLGGLVRNLSASEILDQVLFTQIDSGLPISNIVLMGIGEPLDNFDAVLRFLELVNHPDGMNIGMRHISLSTCGLTEKIDKLASYRLQLTLSVSLHAPDDETRLRLMPVNRTYGVKAVFDACRRYFEKTGRRVSYEYAMINDVNDSDAQADLLASYLKGTPGHVNLIPLNYVEERELKPSQRTASFQKRLEAQGVAVTVRRKLGSDIDASCGQLRRKHLNGERENGSQDGKSQKKEGKGKNGVF
jgi:23S rRNA (adenine2503-C2)-methyltransferase